MTQEPPAYGLWFLVIVNSAVFILFAFSFTRPKSRRDWRSLGAFAGFLVALFAEMYGFPLTIYLLSGWLGSRVPALRVLTHENGHLLQVLLGFEGDPHLNPLHWLSEAMIVGGFILIGAAWRVLFEAQRGGKLAVTGPYSQIRHPQYVGFIVIMLGFLIQWPTIPTLAMFPVLVFMYVRLARREERESAQAFGNQYTRYTAATPGYWPRSLRFRRPRRTRP